MGFFYFAFMVNLCDDNRQNYHDHHAHTTMSKLCHTRDKTIDACDQVHIRILDMSLQHPLLSGDFLSSNHGQLYKRIPLTTNVVFLHICAHTANSMHPYSAFWLYKPNNVLLCLSFRISFLKYLMF